MNAKFFTRMLTSTLLGVSFVFLAMALLGGIGVAPVLADTPVSSPINSDDTWGPGLYGGNPYLITGTVLVQAKLTILPGTEVQFSKDGLLQIGNGGQLIAAGTPADPITFTSRFTKARGTWDGIRFVATSLTGTIQYAVIEYSKVGVELAEGEFHDVSSNTFRYIGDALNPPDSGVMVGSPDNNILNYNVAYSSVNGIRLKKPGDNQIVGNRIYDIDYDCLAFVSDSASSSGGNYINNNEIFTCGGQGISINDNGTGTDNSIVGNVISNTLDDAVYVINQRSITVSHNVIYNITPTLVNGLHFGTFQFGAVVHSNAICVDDRYEIQNTTGVTLTAEGNWLGTNTPAAPPEINGSVDYTPSIILALTPADPALPADGVSTTVLTVTMNDGNGHVVPPLARSVELTTSLGSISPQRVTLDANGVATLTFTSATTRGVAVITATEFCNYSVTATITLQEADVAIAKIGPGGSVRPGETVTYTIVYSNVGNAPAQNVVITDISPITGGVVTLLSGASLNPGESHSLEYVVATNASICGGDYLTNVAYISTTSLENITYNNVATATNPPRIEGCYDLTISKEPAYLLATPGQTVTYAIHFTNTSAISAPGVVITDVLPQYTVFAGSNPPPASSAGGVVTWNVTPDPFPGGANGVIILTITISSAAPTPGFITNTVYIAGSGVESNTLDNRDVATIELQNAVDLSVIKNDNIGTGNVITTAFAGSAISYTIQVRNGGSHTAYGVILTETLPAHTLFAGPVTPNGWFQVGSSSVYTYRVPYAMPQNYSFETEFIVTVDSSLPCDVHEVINVVRTGSGQTDINLNNNESVEQTPVECVPLQLTKTTPLTLTCPGDLVDYTIGISNNNTSTLNNLVLFDHPDANTPFVGPPIWNNAGSGVYTYALGTLNANQQTSVAFSVWVTPGLSSAVTAITNEVTLQPAGLRAVHTLPVYHNIPDLYTVKNDNIEQLPRAALETIARIERKTGPLPWLDALKNQPRAAQAHSVSPGDIISYSIAYGNAGPYTATNVRVLETLPENTQFWGPAAPYWTHLGGRTYVYTVGTLAPGMGDSLVFRVRVDSPFPAGVPGVTNTVTIRGDEALECDSRNNTSVEFTPVTSQTILPSTVYLPIILKNWPPPEPTAQLSWLNQDNDHVSELDGATPGALNPDGRDDGAFSLTVDVFDYSRTIDWIELSSSQSGTPRWNTTPGDGIIVAGVYLGGSQLNSGNGSVTRPLSNQETYTLYLSDDAGNSRFVCYPQQYNYTVIVHFDDGASATASATIPPCPVYYPDWVSDLAVDPDTNQVFIASPRNHAVHVINGALDEYNLSVEVDNQPTGLAVMTATGKVAVGHFTTYDPTWQRGLWFIDTDDLEARPIAHPDGYVGVRPAKVAANSVTGRFYVSNYDDRLAVVDGLWELRLNWVNKTYQRPYGLKFNQGSNILYNATIDTGELIVMDGFQAENPGYNPCHNPLPDTVSDGWNQADRRIQRMVAVNPNTGHVFVTSPPDPNPDNGQNDSRVYVLDEAAFLSAIGGRPSATTCGAVLGKASQSNRPRSIAAEPGVGWILPYVNLGIANAGTEGIAVNPVTNKVYVTDTDGNRVFVFQDGDSGSLALPPQTISGFERPVGIDVNPTTNKIYVANARTDSDPYGTVTVIDGASNTIIKVIRLDGGGTLPLP